MVELARAASTTVAELARVPRCRRVRPPARRATAELTRAPPARTAPHRRRARPCAACSRRAAPSPSLPACHAVSSPSSPASRRRRGRPCAACKHRAAPSLSSPVRPPASTTPRHHRVRPPARVLCRYRARPRCVITELAWSCVRSAGRSVHGSREESIRRQSETNSSGRFF
jgi:hypothetical protein